MGTGPTFQERQWRRVDCQEYGVVVAVGFLLMHHQSQYCVGRGDQVGEQSPL